MLSTLFIKIIKNIFLSLDDGKSDSTFGGTPNDNDNPSESMDCDDSTQQLNIVKDVSDPLPVKDAENVKVLSTPGNTTDFDNGSVICEPPIDKTIPEIIIGTSSEESSSSKQAKQKKSRGNGTHRKLVTPEQESTLWEYRV